MDKLLLEALHSILLLIHRLRQMCQILLNRWLAQLLRSSSNNLLDRLCPVIVRVMMMMMIRLPFIIEFLELLGKGLEVV